MKKSESIKELAAALATAQGQFASAEREKTASVQMKSGGKYSYAYADLAAYLDVCRAPLAANGLSITQEAVTEGNRVHVTTLLMHASGEWIESSPLSLAIISRGGDSVDPQAVGSAITYARRYALSAVLGMASEVDDDAAKASKPPVATTAARQEQPPAAPPPTSVIASWRDRIAKSDTLAALNLIVADFIAWKKAHPAHNENSEIWRQIGLAAEGEFGAAFDKANMKFANSMPADETFPI